MEENGNMEKVSRWKGLAALSPLAVFLVVYLVSSVIAGDFYKVPVSAAFLLACVWGIAVSKGSLHERLVTFSRGAGNENVLLMVWIFVLAGAFAATAKDIGAIEATVNATLRIVPSGMLLAGLFLTSCFISMAIGTSVGTIVALVPIATGIALKSGIGAGQMAAIIVGGALFGDNLSFISDTTIAATRALGCEMKDKFKANIRIVLPAVIITTAIYLFQGFRLDVDTSAGTVEWLKLLPYLLIIVLAFCGCNVTLILSLGIVANAIIGFATGTFGWTGWLVSLGGGIAGMSDLIVITLLAGGLLETIRSNGGLEFIINGLTSRIKSRRGAQLSMAALVCLANLCTANNTIAIITTGGIARDITDRYGLDPKRSASILDTFSCLVQGLIPYGAQILMAASLASCSPTDIIPYLCYPVLMGISALLFILLGRDNRKSVKTGN